MTRSSRRTAAAAALAAIALGIAGCGPQGEPLAGDLRDHVAADELGVGGEPAVGLTFPVPPRLAPATVGGERRAAVLLPEGTWTWCGRVPRRARIAGAVGVPESAGGGPAAVSYTVSAVREFERVVLASGSGSDRWLTFSADLARFAGREITLELTAETPQRGDVAWAPVRIQVPSETARPNVALILVDTLRADRMGIYGAAHPTTPEIARRLAEPGVVVERASAQAPWTLPSVASLMSSRSPETFLPDDVAAYGLPAEGPSLAEVMQSLGYHTAGFFANPTIHEGNGFARGFGTFYSPGAAPTWHTDQRADRLYERVVDWLTVYHDRPYFLYVHFVDPHDPYDNPEIVHNRSPFEGPYAGTVAGDHVHGLYMEELPLRDPEADVRHVRALYDAEVAWTDRWVGATVERIEGLGGETLFALTSDHGEELYDHGGWKHGRMLYEEQLHVPLVLRWDGRFPAGVRLRGPATLLDLAPTLVDAVGGQPPPAWEGRSLVPILERGGVIPRTWLYTQHFGNGRQRAATTLDGWKLLLYDREADFVPLNDYDRQIASIEQRRLERIELYDLADDPREQHNVAADHPDRVRRLGDLLHRRLGAQAPGLRLLLAGASPGTRVVATVTFEAPPTGWASLFLAPGDEVRLDGRTLRLDLAGEALTKGVRLLGEPGAIVAVEVSGAAPVGPDGGSIAAGTPLETLRAGGPSEIERPSLLFWVPEAAPPAAPEHDIDETRQRLEALGYVG